MALSKAKPTYSVQKKLYEMATSPISDEAVKAAKVQASALRYRLLEGIDNNYIYNAAMGNDILRWDIKSFPLKVYIESDSALPDYYYPSIKTAFESWMERTNFVKFNIVDNPEGANILVYFKELPKDVCSNGGCKYTVAYTEPDITKENVLRKMVLTFYKTNPMGEEFTPLEIYNTALHEIGHTLGIMGHSDNPSDIMFSSKDGLASTSVYAAYHSLAMRDLRTLALLYRLKPTISDTKDLSGENLYYPPLIIGGDEVRLQKKLSEYQKYIRQYPNIASGYINLATVYADFGDFVSASKYLLEAQRRAASDDERFLIAYNQAVLYFNVENYDAALEFAMKAKSIKSNQSVDELITDIENVTKK
ncbi:MAG: matrixin family metalloprotease [Muribaculaceae bacterium]|nr:matrixin family metalloprotease [Muribaculaceae bacterium]